MTQEYGDGQYPIVPQQQGGYPDQQYPLQQYPQHPPYPQYPQYPGQQYPQHPQYPHPGMPNPLPPMLVQNRGNGFGVAAMVLGIAAMAASIVPLLGMVAFLLGPLAVVLGIIGANRRWRPKGTSIAGIILGVVGTGVAVLLTMATAGFVSSMDDSLNGSRIVTYKVTADGTGKVSYSTTAGTSNETFNGHWQKNEAVNGIQGMSLSVRSADYSTPGQQFSCELLVDGVSISKQSGTSYVTCAGTTVGKE